VSWAGVDSDDFLCRTQIARCVALVCVANFAMPKDFVCTRLLEEVAAPSHGRACTGVCAFFALSVACAEQMS